MTQPRGAYTGNPCPACQTPKRSRHYLCLRCWHQLPPATRQTLGDHDDRARALARLRQLQAHIDAGHPLGELKITP